MPYLNLRTSTRLDAGRREAVRAAIADHMPILPEKTRDNTMIQIDDGCHLYMGAGEEPCAFIDLRVYQPSPMEAKRAFIEKLCAALASLIDTPVNRIYVNLIEMENWGANGVYK